MSTRITRRGIKNGTERRNIKTKKRSSNCISARFTFKYDSRKNVPIAAHLPLPTTKKEPRNVEEISRHGELIKDTYLAVFITWRRVSAERYDVTQRGAAFHGSAPLEASYRDREREREREKETRKRSILYSQERDEVVFRAKGNARISAIYFIDATCRAR